ncbi:MAG: SDR family NAD(P)-dependent oxidoreductase [Actinobacteria bacterium]|nr:SDR family NAD(P)-dependent oxidoreductase [Actinomycetota bacterium]
MPDLNGGHSSIIIAGAASGIGLATTRRLLKEWPNVKIIAADIQSGALAEVEKEFGKERLLILKSDITSAEGAAKVVETAATWANPLSGLVVTAGNSTNHASLELTPEQWKEVRDCHLDGHFYMNQAFARHLVANKIDGAIVNFSSVAHIFGWPRRLPYAVAKAGIDALTRTLAVEWAEFNIRVNAIAPGYVNTSMVINAQQAGYLDPSIIDMHAMKRFSEPDEIAAGVQFLLSNEASFITGEILTIDGGFTAKKIPWNK